FQKFFQPAVVNIKVNLGSDSVTEENIRDICKKILEEAKSMYIIPLREKEQSGFEYCSNEQGFECTDARFSHFESVGLIGHQAQKRKDVQLETDSSVSFLPSKRSKSKLLSNYYNDNLGCKFSLKRDGPKWNPERIKAHTQFIMGSRANKVLGYGQTRGRLYVRHPNLLRYCGDQEDKEWLQSQNLLPANGGKIYIMLLQDIQELTESDEYCNNPNLQLQELQGFEAPMFMCDKIRNFLEYIKNEKKLMAVLDVDENSSEITTVLPDTDERSEKNVWRTSQLRQQIDYPNMSSDMSTLSSSVISSILAGTYTPIDTFKGVDDIAHSNFKN
ncbi:deoxynucleotidyltransferase terminal-interacting protein 1-like, partial [Dendroctonus ponderosae]